METKEVQIFTDWNLLRGNDITESLLIKICQEENEPNEKTILDDIVSFERSIHLQNNVEDTNEINKSTCDINFQIIPRYIVNTLTIISDCEKVEIFKNVEKEYLNTVYGDFLDDFDGIQVYRHDIETKKTETCNNLTIKFIPKAHKIWIYGMEIVLLNNPKPINNLGCNSINLDNVQNILSNFNQKISPNAEKCKSFIKFMTTNGGNSNLSPNKILGLSNLGNTQNVLTMFNNTTNSPNMEQLMSILNSNVNVDPKLIYNDNMKVNKICIAKDIYQLKEYFDKKIVETEHKLFQRIEKMKLDQNEKFYKIVETENKILERIEKMEIAQNSKIEKILNILENNKAD